MGKLELIRDLYQYNEWANGRIVETAEALDSAALEGDGETSWGSVVATMAHVAAAQEAWLARWRTGRNPRPTVEVAQSLASLGDVADLLDGSQAGIREFLAEVTEEALDADLVYLDSAGTAETVPLWQLMTHVANHGTYHRGEVAAALTALGHSPGDLDFVYWERDRDGGSRV